MTQQTKSMVTDMTSGNVTKLLLSFAFPLFVSNALQAIYNIVDMIVVGQNLGAKEYERVPRILRTVGTCTIVISTVFAVGIGMFQESVYALFTSDVSGMEMRWQVLFRLLLECATLFQAAGRNEHRSCFQPLAGYQFVPIRR